MKTNNSAVAPTDTRFLLGYIDYHLAYVLDVPNVEAVIVVDDGHPRVLLVIRHGARVRVLRVVGVRGHVRDGQALGHVHAQVVRPRQRRHELKKYFLLFFPAEILL